MTQRIKEAQLHTLIKTLNEITGNETNPYRTDPETGRYAGSNIGTYMLDQAYGGNRLVQIANEHGGITVVSNGGFVTKRELWNQLHTLIRFAHLQEG